MKFISILVLCLGLLAEAKYPVGKEWKNCFSKSGSKKCRPEIRKNEELSDLIFTHKMKAVSAAELFYRIKTGKDHYGSLDSAETSRLFMLIGLENVISAVYYGHDKECMAKGLKSMEKFKKRIHLIKKEKENSLMKFVEEK